jgi:transcription initiation factor IIE alpha subunit
MIYGEANRKETVMTICFNGAQKAAPAEQYTRRFTCRSCNEAAKFA